MNDLVPTKRSKYTLSPQAIYKELSKTVIGQDEAKRQVSNFLFYNAIQLIRGGVNPTKTYKPMSLLITGPSGNGKTHIISEAVKAVQRITKSDLFPLLVVDCTNLVVEGWHGQSFGDYLGLHLQQNIEKEFLATTLVYFDEFDKLALPHVSSGGIDSHKQVQYALLKLVEGGTYTYTSPSNHPKTADTSSYSFIFSGNFANLRKDRDEEKKQPIGFTGEPEYKDLPMHKRLQKAGLSTQLAGRISSIVEIKPLTKQDLENIVRHQLVPEIIDFFSFLGYTIYIDTDTINQVVEEAMKHETGARGLKAALETAIQDELFKTKIQVERE